MHECHLDFIFAEAIYVVDLSCLFFCRFLLDCQKTHNFFTPTAYNLFWPRHDEGGLFVAAIHGVWRCGRLVTLVSLVGFVGYLIMAIFSGFFGLNKLQVKRSRRRSQVSKTAAYVGVGKDADTFLEGIEATEESTSGAIVCSPSNKKFLHDKERQYDVLRVFRAFGCTARFSSGTSFCRISEVCNEFFRWSTGAVPRTRDYTQQHSTDLFLLPSRMENPTYR
ncbi:hypothetical protein Tco_1300518 [Tanacetum coccineum]